jgi:hypothetical protein
VRLLDSVEQADCAFPSACARHNLDNCAHVDSAERFFGDDSMLW